MYVQITIVGSSFYSNFVTVDHFNPTSFHNTFCYFFFHLTISGPGHDLHLFTCSTAITVSTLSKYDTILCFLIRSFKFTKPNNSSKWNEVMKSKGSMICYFSDFDAIRRTATDGEEKK